MHQNNFCEGDLDMKTSRRRNKILAVLLSMSLIFSLTTAMPVIGATDESSGYLNVDFNNEPYVLDEFVLSSDTRPHQEAVDGGYTHNNSATSSSAFGGNSKIVAGAGDMNGEQVMLFTTGTSNRVINRDLDTAIEPNTGTYAISFDYMMPNESQYVRFSFSEKVCGEARNSASEITGDNYLEIKHNGLTWGDDSVADELTTQTWYTVYGVIDTDNDSVTWYLSEKGLNKTMDEVVDGSGIKGDLPAITEGFINSILFVTGSGKDWEINLANIKIDEYVDPSILLNVDFNDTSIYTEDDLLVESNAPHMTQHASGWYNSAGNSSEFGGDDYAKIVTDGGKQALEIQNSSSGKAVNIDLGQPIEKNTGLYGLTFEYKVPNVYTGYFGLGLSDTAYGSLGENSGYSTGSNLSLL